MCGWTHVRFGNFKSENPGIRKFRKAQILEKNTFCAFIPISTVMEKLKPFNIRTITVSVVPNLVHQNITCSSEKTKLPLIKKTSIKNNLLVRDL